MQKQKIQKQNTKNIYKRGFASGCLRKGSAYLTIPAEKIMAKQSGGVSQNTKNRKKISLDNIGNSDIITENKGGEGMLVRCAWCSTDLATGVYVDQATLEEVDHTDGICRLCQETFLFSYLDKMKEDGNMLTDENVELGINNKTERGIKLA